MEKIILKHLIQLRTRGTKGYQTIIKEQENRLKYIVKYAYNYSKFYRELYDKNNININDFNLRSLPVISKDDILCHYDDILTVSDINMKMINEYASQRKKSNLLNKYSIFSSGGSSGIRCHIPYDLEGMCTINALTLLRSGLFQKKVKQRIAFLGGVNHSSNTGNLGHNNIIRNQFQILVIPLYYSEEEVIKRLNEFQPTTIASYSYMLRDLAVAQIEGKLKIRPTRLRCGGTPFLKKDKALVYRAFGQLPIENYGACEALMIGSACKAHAGMHINEDCYKVEFVDTDLNYIKEGQISDGILVTNLYNKVFPLIRYRMEDRLTFTTQKCRCGCRLPRILSVQGRKTDMFEYTKGEQILKIHPIDISNRILDLREIKEFRLIQKEKNTLNINLALSSECNDEQLTRKVVERIKELFYSKEVKIKLEVAVYPHLLTDKKSGKLVPFITTDKYQKLAANIESNGKITYKED